MGGSGLGGFTLTINKIVYLILLTINRALKNKIERFLILG